MRAYLSLLDLPGARSFSAAALLGRMPIAMLGIGSVLLVEDRRGSYALAGAVAAAFALGLAVVGPAVSRLVDRRGQRRVLPVCLAVSSAGLVGVLLAASSAPAAVLLALAAVTGAALPPLGSCVRARWSTTLRLADRESGLERAFALESVADEVVFVAGPALVAGLAVGIDPVAGLLVALALQVVGTTWFIAQRATEPPVTLAAAGAGTRSAVRVPGLVTAALGMVFVGVVFGGLEVAMVAFADQEGRPGAAGLLLPLIAVGSAASGLAYGARTWTWALEQRYLLALLGLAVGTVPVVLAPTVAVMVPAALLAGLAVSPTLIASFGLVEQLVPPSARTEGFAWLNSGLGAGAATGSAVAGALAEGPGASVAFLTCLVGAVLAGLVTLARRATLVAPGRVPALG